MQEEKFKYIKKNMNKNNERITLNNKIKLREKRITIKNFL